MSRVRSISSYPPSRPCWEAPSSHFSLANPFQTDIWYPRYMACPQSINRIPGKFWIAPPFLLVTSLALFPPFISPPQTTKKAFKKFSPHNAFTFTESRYHTMGVLAFFLFFRNWRSPLKLSWLWMIRISSLIPTRNFGVCKAAGALCSLSEGNKWFTSKIHNSTDVLRFSTLGINLD